MPIYDGKVYGPDDTSWWDHMIDRLEGKISAPPTQPLPPKVNEEALQKSVDNSRVNDLTVHQIGLILFNETQSLSDHPDSNESLDNTREKLAHVIINGDLKYGPRRPSTAGAIEPSPQTLANPTTQTAYNSSMSAARRAYLSPSDPTGGAVHFDFHTGKTPYFGSGNSGNPGPPLKTQSGPFKNSYPKGKLNGPVAYANTYGPG